MTIHDHFDGSAHCVECKGPCKLTGDERAVTEFIRFTLERFSLNGWTRLPHFEERAITQLGLNPEHLMRRANATSPPRKASS